MAGQGGDPWELPVRIVLNYRSSSRDKGSSRIKSNVEELLLGLPDKMWAIPIWDTRRLAIMGCFSEIELGILYLR